MKQRSVILSFRVSWYMLFIWCCFPLTPFIEAAPRQKAPEAATRSSKGGNKNKKGSSKNKIPVVAMEDDVLVMPGQEYAVVSFVDKRDYTGMNEGNSREVQAAQAKAGGPKTDIIKQEDFRYYDARAVEALV